MTMYNKFLNEVENVIKLKYMKKNVYRPLRNKDWGPQAKNISRTNLNARWILVNILDKL